MLIGLIPIIGGIWLLIELGFLVGTPGPEPVRTAAVGLKEKQQVKAEPRP